jgi:enoyl-CoA hydratase/carnithine racemase
MGDGSNRVSINSTSPRSTRARTCQSGALAILRPCTAASFAASAPLVLKRASAFHPHLAAHSECRASPAESAHLNIFITGERFSPQRAYEIGLINQVVPKDRLGRLRRTCTSDHASLPAHNASYYFGRNAGLEHLHRGGLCDRRRAIRAHGRHPRYAQGTRGVALSSRSRQSNLLISMARKARSEP